MFTFSVWGPVLGPEGLTMHLGKNNVEIVGSVALALVMETRFVPQIIFGDLVPETSFQGCMINTRLQHVGTITSDLEASLRLIDTPTQYTILVSSVLCANNGSIGCRNSMFEVRFGVEAGFSNCKVVCLITAPPLMLSSLVCVCVRLGVWRHVFESLVAITLSALFCAIFLHVHIRVVLSACPSGHSGIQENKKWKLSELVGLVSKTLVEPVRLICPT